MRTALMAALFLVTGLSGCVGEFLGPPTTTARTVACAVIDEGPVVIEHHGTPPPGTNDAVAAWFAVMAAATDTDVNRFSSRQGVPVDEVNLVEIPVLGKETVLHILWDDHALDTMDIPAPGVLRVNLTAIDVATQQHGRDPERMVQGILFHGLGHVLGVVNAGIPRYDANAPASETPGHHEAGTVMSSAWHRLEDRPLVADRYPESVIRDWENAAADRRICP